MARGRGNQNGPGRNKGDGWDGWGGYMKAKQEKLRSQYAKDGITSDIFKGVAIHVNGYTKPSSDELKRLVVQHGGYYEHYLFKRQVTHIIATSIASSKVKDLKHMKIVKPEWIVDSVASGKLLSYVPYQLYTAQTRIQPGMGGFAANTTTLSTTASTSSDTSVNKYRNMEEESSNCQLDEMHCDDHGDDDSILGLNFDVEEGASDSEASSKIDNKPGSNSPNISAKKPLHLNINKSLISKDKTISEVNPNHVCDNNMESEGKDDSVLKPNASFLPKTSPSKMARAGDSNFLAEFYGNSRLHHLSTWGAEFKAYVAKLQEENSGDFPGRENLRKFHLEAMQRAGEMCSESSVQGKPKKVIMHIDMDCFFVSVGLLERPDLRGKPVAVTHSKNKGRMAPVPGSDPDYEKKHWKSAPCDNTKDDDMLPPDLRKYESFQSFAEIASCSYEARKFGVKNGMFMGPAKQLCPELYTIPYNFEKYQEVSKQLYDTIASYTHDIEAVSCDEMLVDCTDLLADTGATAEEFASMLRKEIYNKTLCCASAGMASNILLAKMATKRAKPNGQFYLQHDVIEFMKPQSVRNIPGVGYSMTKKMAKMEIKTCGDLQNVPLNTLKKEFGPKTGQSLYRSCRGEDDRPIKMETERKSVSAEINYGIRFQKDQECAKFLEDLSEEVHNRLTKVNLKGKVVTLKLKVRRDDAPTETAKFMGHGLCNNFSKSSTLPLATDDGSRIAKECMTLLQQLKINVQDLRGIGIQMQRLEADPGSSLKSKNSVKDNQSILNFAVSKSNTMSKTDEDCKEKAPTKTDIGSPNSHLSKSTMQVSSESPSGIYSSNPPLIDSNTYKDFNMTETHEPSCSQAIVERHRVTLMSGHTLADELARRKTAKGFLPPLPSLPNFDLGTPESKSSLSVNTDVHSSPVDYFPSPSQVDQEVLKELPQDIREQIEKEMNSRKLKSNLEERTNRMVDNSQEAGCSHWAGDTESNLSAHVSSSLEDNSQIVALPSLSQIDLDCLSALPQELQEELKLAYKQQTTNLQPQTAVLKLKSPTKNCSPRKNKKNSPLFKVPKGSLRKKQKLSPKKLLFSNRKNNQHRKTANNNEEIHAEKIEHLNDINKEISIKSYENTIRQNITLSESDDRLTESKSVNLCGAVNITEVRTLLKEWLNTCSEPQEEDVNVLTKYINELILDQNLEQVDLVLKFLYRNIKRLKNQFWNHSLCNIVANTQSLIQSLHKSQLNVDYMNMKILMECNIDNTH